MRDRHAPRKNKIPKERKDLIKQVHSTEWNKFRQRHWGSFKNMFKDTLQSFIV